MSKENIHVRTKARYRQISGKGGGGLDFMGNINRIWSVYTCIDMTSVLGVCGRALNAPLRQYGSYIYSSWE